MKKDEPLIIRLHFQKPLFELVRLIGYEGVAEAELRETVKALIAEYGMEKMEPAASELTQTDGKTRLVTLRPEVRRIAFQILGPPPERADYSSYWASQGVPSSNRQPTAEPPNEGPPRTCEGSKTEARPEEGSEVIGRPPQVKAWGAFILCVLKDYGALSPVRFTGRSRHDHHLAGGFARHIPID